MRTIPERNASDLATPFTLEPDLAQHLAEPDVEQDALPVGASDAQDVDGGGLGECRDGRR